MSFFVKSLPRPNFHPNKGNKFLPVKAKTKGNCTQDSHPELTRNWPQAWHSPPMQKGTIQRAVIEMGLSLAPLPWKDSPEWPWVRTLTLKGYMGEGDCPAGISLSRCGFPYVLLLKRCILCFVLKLMYFHITATNT